MFCVQPIRPGFTVVFEKRLCMGLKWPRCSLERIWIEEGPVKLFVEAWG